MTFGITEQFRKQGLASRLLQVGCLRQLKFHHLFSTRRHFGDVLSSLLPY
jgi:hypothetical protein